jgi:HD-like signal output (HDOD) protein
MDDLIDFAELKSAGLLPAPSKEALELVQLCQSGDDDIGPLLARIVSMPALEYALLALSGQRGCDALPEALAAVGSAATAQLIVALDLASQYQRGACSDFDYPRHWSHAFATACAAQALTAEMPVGSGIDLFCLGLLADIGRLALATARPRSYARLLRECSGAPASTLLRKDSALYGYSHLSMGAALLRSWRIGNDYADAVLCQEAPHMATDRNTRHLARLLQLASCMADLYLAQPGERRELVADMAATSTRLQLDTRVLLDVVDEANTHWRQWCAAMGLHAHLPLAVQAIQPAAATAGIAVIAAMASA